MTNNGAVETFEVERKYAVSAFAEFPAPAEFVHAGLKQGPIQNHELNASYFDTPHGDLWAKRSALRQRTGGKDEGWHLKFKGEHGSRELLWPHAQEMPEGVRAEIACLVGASQVPLLTVIATLRTQRRTIVLFDQIGSPVIELADDMVDATNQLTGKRQQWREWEAELLPGVDTVLLDLLEPLLLAQGAERVRGTSKIQRTMQAE